jgi:hypothetical protein
MLRTWLWTGRMTRVWRRLLTASTLCALLIVVLPGGVDSARSLRSDSILYQVRWAGWQQSIGNWTSYALSGRSVKRGIMNLGAAGGVRPCSTDAGAAYCNRVVALFAP